MKNDIQKKLIEFWQKRVGAKYINSFDGQGAAATFHPRCFFGSLDKTMQPIVYVQPSWRFDDHTQGKSTIRFANHTQVQLLMPYYPGIIKDYKDSLKYIGIKDNQCLQFVENNWQHKSLGANGVGWEILVDNLEIMQFTFFEYIGQEKLFFTPVELAYGLERLNFITGQAKKHENLALLEEIETSKMITLPLYKESDLKNSLKKCEILIRENLPLKAYRFLLDCNKIFNIIGNNFYYDEKNHYIKTIGQIAAGIAKKYRSLYI